MSTFQSVMQKYFQTPEFPKKFQIFLTKKLYNENALYFSKKADELFQEIETLLQDSASMKEDNFPKGSFDRKNVLISLAGDFVSYYVNDKNNNPNSFEGAILVRKDNQLQIRKEDGGYTISFPDTSNLPLIEFEELLTYWTEVSSYDGGYAPEGIIEHIENET